MIREPLCQEPVGNSEVGHESTPIRLVIVHPSRLLREAIAFALSRQVGIVVAANVGGIVELTDQSDLLQPTSIS